MQQPMRNHALALGLPFTFGIDALTFAFSPVAVSAIRSVPPAESAPPAGVSSILEDLKYAASRPEVAVALRESLA
jgi:hypothetical protein